MLYLTDEEWDRLSNLSMSDDDFEMESERIIREHVALGFDLSDIENTIDGIRYHREVEKHFI